MTCEEFKSLRTTRQWTLARMAEEMGVTIPTVWRWENDKAPSSTLSLKAIERLVADHPVERAA